MSEASLPPFPPKQWFQRARVPVTCLAADHRPHAVDPLEPWWEVDIAVAGDRIVEVCASGASRPGAIDLGGVLVFPGLLDSHTHLDKTHTWGRAPNPSGEFWDAIRILHEDSHRWSEADLYRRASLAMETAWAQGTSAIRTHLDTGDQVGEASFAVMNTLRREWAGRIALQTVSLCSLQAFADGQARQVVSLAKRYGATALGGFPQPNPDLDRQLDALMAAAKDLGLGLDLHVDESGLLHAECLRATAAAVLRNRFPHPVACGHNCSLAVQDRTRALDTLKMVRDAGISLVSLPLCNLYLQGRTRTGGGTPGTPYWRGLTLLHEALELGIPTAAASDNVRDAFYAWGDYDLLEVWQQAVRIGHLDTRMAESVSLVTTGPAALMGLPDHGRVAPGAVASLVVTQAPTFNLLLARPSATRSRIHGAEWLRPERPSLAAVAH